MDLLTVLSQLMLPQFGHQQGNSPDNNITNSLVRMGALPQSQFEYLPQPQFGRGASNAVYPHGTPLSVNDSPAYPEHLTRPSRAPRLQPGQQLGIGALQPATSPIAIADEGGAFSPQVQRRSAVSPIQGGGVNHRGAANPLQPAVKANALNRLLNF